MVTLSQRGLCRANAAAAPDGRFARRRGPRLNSHPRMHDTDERSSRVPRLRTPPPK